MNLDLLQASDCLRSSGPLRSACSRLYRLTLSRKGTKPGKCWTTWSRDLGAKCTHQNATFVCWGDVSGCSARVRARGLPGDSLQAAAAAEGRSAGLQTSTLSPRGIPGPHSPPRDGTLGTLLAAPSRRPPLIAASCASRSKLTFCTLHYAPARIPRGRRPAPAHADNLIGQLIFVAHGPPPAPTGLGLCAVSAGRRPGRPPGLLALIRAPAPPPLSCGEPGRAVSHPVSAPPPLGLGPSVGAARCPPTPPRRRAGGGVPWAGMEPAPPPPGAPCVRSVPPSQRHRRTRARTHAGAAQLNSMVMTGGGEKAAVCAAGEGKIPAGAKSGESLPPHASLHPRCGAWLVAPVAGAEEREREREVLWEFARHFRLFVSFLGLGQKLTPLHHPQPQPQERLRCD